MKDTSFVFDKFLQTQVGKAYRLLPFGPLYKNGVKRVITPEFAALFKLPHFKPPIKLGSHEETTPSGGHLIGLEVREDGLYGVPEYNDQGVESLANGDYKYHSPEILWEDRGYENPLTGEIIAGPLIVGDALLHTPHLGEAAALYTSETLEVDMDENVSVPKTLWDKIMDRFDSLFARVEPIADATTVLQPVVTTTDNDVADKLSAAHVALDEANKQIEKFKAEAEAHAAKLAEIENARVESEKRNALIHELQDVEKFGSMYIDLKSAEEAAMMMGGMTEEQRSWCMRNFSALTSQIKTSALYGETGTSTQPESDDPRVRLDSAIRARMAEKKVDYNSALVAIMAEKPELYSAAYEAKEK